MFNRYLILPAVCLLASCIAPYSSKPYAPAPEMLGATPATLRIEPMGEGSKVSESAVSIARHDVICRQPGETKATITPLGYTENSMRERQLRGESYSVQLPSNQRILVYSYFTIEYFFQALRVCNLAVSFVPEPGAVYQLDRTSHTSYTHIGECSVGIHKVVATNKGETLEKLKDYRWGPIEAFPNERFICDEQGNYTLKPPGQKKQRATGKTRAKKKTEDTGG
ncbi:MAG TPA: hypothetical protein VFX02_04015 [Gammaproteobacteria bacterium]|nr:hypothetical protein [Gammaproteobacteria bacterium]